MHKKRIISSTLLALLLLTFVFTFFATTSFATENDIISISPKQDVFVYDEANLIDDTVEKDINQLLVALEEKSGAEFAVISIPSLNNLTIEEYSNKLFNKLGIGKAGKDNGVLLLFSKTDNRVRLEIGRGLEGCLNDGKCGRILDEYFVPYREEDKYTDAANLTTSAVLTVICEEYNIEIDNLDKVEVSDEEDVSIWLIIILVILLIIIATAVQSSSGGSGYSGSSYGGSFSSRGGFGGGFGGGFSGGGGASR